MSESDYGSEPDEIVDDDVDIDIPNDKVECEGETDKNEQNEYVKFTKRHGQQPVKKRGAPKKTITKADVKELNKFCKGKFIQDCSNDQLKPLEVSVPCKLDSTV